MKSLTFEPGRYPRTYRPSLVLRIGMGVVVIPLLLGTIGMQTSPPGDWGTTSIALAMVAAMAWVWLALLVARVVLEPAAIEIRALRQTWSIERSAIEGYRLRHTDRHRATVMVAGKAAQRLGGTLCPLAIDDAFEAWFAGVPDAVAPQARHYRQLAAADPRLGATPVERLARAIRVRLAVLRLWIVGIVLAAGLVVVDPPVTWILPLLSALPLLAFALCRRSPELFSMATPRFSLRNDLRGLIALPAFVQGFHALRDVTLVAPLHWLVSTVVVGAILTALARVSCSDLRGRPGATLLIAGLCMAHVAGALAIANVAYDASMPTNEGVRIAARLKSGGRSPTCSLRLDAVPSGLASRVVRVREDVWRASVVGQQACIRQHDGLFQWRWFDVAASCPP